MYCIPDKVNVLVSVNSDMICSGFVNDLFRIENGELKQVEYEDTDCI